jgi:3'-5' exonuclease
LWMSGDLAGVIRYNELDALTTFLVWARLARFADLLDAEAYAREEQAVRALIEEESDPSKRPEKDRAHLQRFLKEWDRLRKLTTGSRASALS